MVWYFRKIVRRLVCKWPSDEDSPKLLPFPRYIWEAQQQNKRHSDVPHSEMRTPRHGLACWKLHTEGWRSAKEGAQTHKHTNTAVFRCSAFIWNTQPRGATKMFCSLTSIVYSCKSASDNTEGGRKTSGAVGGTSRPAIQRPASVLMLLVNQSTNSFPLASQTLLQRNHATCAYCS